MPATPMPACCRRLRLLPSPFRLRVSRVFRFFRHADDDDYAMFDMLMLI